MSTVPSPAPLIDEIPGYFAILAPDGTVEAANDQLLDYCGVGLAELRDWGTNGIVHPDDMPQVSSIFGHSIATGTPYAFELRVRRFDGAYRWLDNRGAPVRNAAGRILQWYVLLIDVDDRKRAEADLVAALHHLNAAQSLGKTGSYIADLGRDIHLWSDEFYRICEFEIGSEIRVDTLASIVLPEDIAHFSSAIERALGGEQPNFEFRIGTRSGAVKHLHGIARRIADEPMFAGAVTDITERKATDEQLRRSEAFLSKAQELSLTGSFSWTSQSPRDFVCSEQIYRLFEIAPGTRITPTLLRSLYHANDRHFLLGSFRRARRGLGIDFEHRVVFADGRTKHLHVSATQAPTEAGEIEYFGAVQDVTQRRLNQDALERVRGELEHATRFMSLGTLAASIAHEVNQPLSGVITNANTALRMLTVEPPDIEGAIETARRTIRDGRRASDVIARLRALFTRKVLEVGPVDLNAAAQEVLELARPDLARRRILHTAKFAATLPPVMGDRVQLQQVILNLVLNASDALKNVADRPRELQVRTEHRDGAVQLSVSDTGPGIAPDALDHLFDPFFTTKTQGMGIGLSVSRSIIERHDGRLWASSEPGPGATFSFSIPCSTGGAESGGLDG